MASPKLGDLWDRMTLEQKKKAFFFVYAIVDFYASTDTWFATTVVGDPPCGDIVRDVRLDEEGESYRPGGRARLARTWIHSAFRRLLTSDEAVEVKRLDAEAEAEDKRLPGDPVDNQGGT